MRVKLSFSFTIERSKPEPEAEREVDMNAYVENRGAPTYTGFAPNERADDE